MGLGGAWGEERKKMGGDRHVCLALGFAAGGLAWEGQPFIYWGVGSGGRGCGERGGLLEVVKECKRRKETANHLFVLFAFVLFLSLPLAKILIFGSLTWRYSASTRRLDLRESGCQERENKKKTAGGPFLSSHFST